VCILLVEDEWLIRTMVAEELMDGGFAVREAEDGDQASILIAQDPTAFTLLVTDIHMPGSLDGIGVAHLMRAHRPDFPVIYTTGRPDVLNHLQPFGPREVLLRKPFALSALLATARRLLGHPH
jgi:DNA-binding response OmpR family regulator